jgi:DNA-binding transcriptional LysR family regulator
MAPPSSSKPRVPADWHLRARLKARQLALVVAIADQRSLRRAAGEIAVSQPAATRMLAELEDALGVPLFDRAAWGMQPTPYGETLIRYARGMLTDLSEARDEIAALASGATGRLRIGAETGAVPRLLTPALRDVRDQRPGLQVFVLVNTSDVLVAALRQGTLDVAIGHLPARADAQEFDVVPLRTDPLRVVVRAGHPLAREGSVTPAALAAIGWILHPPDSGMRAEAAALLARAGVRPGRDLVETVSIVATLALLEATDAASVLPQDLVDHYAAQGLLVPLRVPVSAGGAATELITRRNRRLSPAALALVAALRRIAAAPRPKAVDTLAKQPARNRTGKRSG